MFSSKLDYLNNILNLFNAKCYRQVSEKKIKDLISLFKPFSLNIQLKRIGSNNDGGYLVPDILDDVKYCFSPGVGNSSNFEKDLEKYNITSFLADKNVNGPATELKKFNFDKKNINSFNCIDKININDWIYSKIDKSEINKSILQIDTDGYEYEILLSINEEILSEIKILLVEFHGLELIGNEFFYNIVESTLEKIKLYHTPIHIHPNNCCGNHKINKFKIPSVLEVIFLNNSLSDNKKEINSLPHKLDSRNVKKKKDIILESYWYK